MNPTEKPLPSPSTLRADYKNQFQQEFTSFADLLEDALENGPFHNESLSAIDIARHLPKEALLRIYLPVARALSDGLVTSEYTDIMGPVARCYEELNKWQDGKLTRTDDLLNALAAVRILVVKGFRNRHPTGTDWWIETVAYFKILEVGIARSMGLDTDSIESAYQELLSA